MAKLSEPKRNALEEIRDAGEYRLLSAGTIGALQKAGLVELRQNGRYVLTDAGRAALSN